MHTAKKPLPERLCQQVTIYKPFMLLAPVPYAQVAINLISKRSMQLNSGAQYPAQRSGQLFGVELGNVGIGPDFAYMLFIGRARQ